jgi:lipopolysaccharide transport system ATP-binding protein
VSFEVKKGETIGIIGRNGCGKSTLLQMICGTLTPTNGSIQTTGRIAALLELGSGFNPEFNGRENVYLNATVLGLSKEEIDARFNDIIKFADIGEFIDQPVKTYSSGMYVRLAFAVIAHVDADILVVDEALAVGDIFFQQKCMRYLRSLQERGGTVVFVSHDTSAVVNLCDNAILLIRGKNTVIGKTDDICQLYIEDLYSERGASTENLNQIPDSEDLIAPIISLPKVHASTNIFGGADQPENIIRTTPFRNDAESFGRGGAKITDIWFEDEKSEKTSTFLGGRPVNLYITIKANQDLLQPAFGFMLKDRLGQYVFAEGTDLAYRNTQLVIKTRDEILVKFSFTMPILIQGEYSLNVAVAEGMGDDHIQHHWINDVMALHSLKSRLVHGICGLQNLTIGITVTSNLESE